MSQYIFKLPDLGEGTVEAEIVAWHVKPGDEVREDAALVEVMTDKASVEVPAPVTGRVVSARGEPGERIAVGATLAVFETQAATPAPAARAESATSQAEPSPSQPAARGARVMASPATRRRAHEAGIDLTCVQGTGPNGRIVRGDLEQDATAAKSPSQAAGGTTEIKVIGLRRVIAERMSESKRTIPHFAFVEEVDLTELDALRQALNARDGGTLTYLPFIAMALIRALAEFPQCNALYDAARGVIVQHHAVHLGIATQTPDGLKVPVVREAQAQGLRQLAENIRSAADAARTNRATRHDLTGSTITLTSLGKLGGIVSTPIINAPEVAIIGLNRAVERPVIYRGTMTARLMMNISSSFDHRFVDGHDAAAMIQAVKFGIEHPATIFLSKADL